MEFRKLIRDLVLNQIKSTNCFDIILEDNEAYHDYFKKNSNEVILFQQDDDDIFMSSFPVDINDGITIFNYNWIDPLCMRRPKQYRFSKNHVYKRYINIGKIESVQTNHTILNNRNCLINFNPDEKVLNTINPGPLRGRCHFDHTQYEKLGNTLRIFSRENHKNYINFSNTSYTVQFYHLCSHSTWKKYVRDRNNTQNLTKTQFLKIVQSYITELNNLNLKNIPLLSEFKLLYSKLV